MKFFWIPVELCEYAICDKFIRPFQVYIVLKTFKSSKVKLGEAELKYIADTIGLKSNKAVKNNLKLLIDRNWIGYDKKSKIYFIRGFQKVKSIQGVESRTCAEFDIRHIKQFKAFLAGAVIGYLVKQQKRKEWLDERQNGRSKHSSHDPSKYYPIANLGLAKILNISISTAYMLKSDAAKHLYILVKKNFEKTGLDAWQKKSLMIAFPEKAKSIRIIKGKIHFQLTDTVLPCIRFKKGKKSKHINLGS